MAGKKKKKNSQIPRRFVSQKGSTLCNQTTVNGNSRRGERHKLFSNLLFDISQWLPTTSLKTVDGKTKTIKGCEGSKRGQTGSSPWFSSDLWFKNHTKQ